MISSLCLHFAGIFLSYALQVAAIYVTCVLLSRLLRKPQQRFLLWMAFLVASATYWLGLIWSEARALPRVLIGSGNLPTGGGRGWLHPLLIPASWSHGILMAGEVLALGYLSCLALLLGLAGWRHLQLRLILRRAVEPSAALASLFHTIRGDFGVSRSRLLVLPGLRSPATACWWRPRILLPDVCEDLGPTPQVADVLYHELFHVARRDYLWAGISDFICRLLFFHPVVWRARKRLRLEGELACDRAVVEARPTQRADYADSLAYFVRLRMLQEGISVGVDFAASSSTLGIRIRTILDLPQPLPWWKRVSQVVAAMALVTATALLVPALTVLLDFARPNLVEAASQPQASPSAPPARRHTARRLSTIPAATSPANQDSLTSLRARPTVRETPAYALTANASRPDSELDDMDQTGWTASGPPVRSVSSVILANIPQIPVGKYPRGRDRDHDGDEH